MSGYVFKASGDACEICAALDGTNCDTLPHENCQCQIEADDGCDHELSGSSEHYGSGDYDARFGGELTVTCADGTSFGMSIDVDLGGFNPAGETDFFDYLDDLLADKIDALCDGCPPPRNVS